MTSLSEPKTGVLAGDLFRGYETHPKSTKTLFFAPESATTVYRTFPSYFGDRLISWLNTYRYEFVSEIGGGARGKVCLVTDYIGKSMIFKHIEYDVDDGDFTLLSRIRGEALALSLPEHLNLARTYAVVTTCDGKKYRYRTSNESPLTGEQVVGVFQEYALGSSLQQILKKRGAPLSLDEVKALGFGIARGIEAMHEKRFLHRDLKPDNIMVLPDGTVKIIDYSFLIQLSQMKRTSSFVCAPWYRAPEVDAFIQSNRHHDEKMDAWSFGCILFEMASGSPLFKGISDSGRFGFYELKSPDPGKYIPEKIETLKGKMPESFLELLRGLLDLDQSMRLDIQNALKSPFFQK